MARTWVEGAARQTETAASQNAEAVSVSEAARRMGPRGLMDASGSNQLPVRIARGDVPGKRPDIGDVRDLVRASIHNGAGLVAGRRDHLRDKTHRQLCAAVADFGADQLGLVDRDEPGFRLLLMLL